ncbi:MAG: nickel-dependent lactate racemase [Myxococcota bacterium]
MEGGFLTYGSERVACRPPGRVTTLLPLQGPPSRPEADIVRDALEHPDGTPPLRELAKGRRTAIVLIACRTRRTGSAVFLPEILRELNAAGLRDEDVLVYTATGTHDNYREQDAPLLAGEDCARRLRFAGHDCRNDLVEVGTTSRGNRVRLSRAYLEADLKIATGRVTYHYFAGFTGGRKAILPGVAAFETIATNHRQASLVEGGVRLNPATRNGRLADNPIHLDMLEAARLAPPDFTLNTVLDTENRILHAFGGDMERSHERATAIVGPGDSPVLPAPVDWLLLSCGGAHLDVNAVQSIKAVLNSYQAVRPGGAIILSAECAEGIAPWLREVCSVKDPAELDRRIAAGELRHPHNALWIRQVRERAHVVMVTKLSEDEVTDLGFHKAGSLEHAMALARELSGPPETSAVVPFGNTTVVRVEAPA